MCKDKGKHCIHYHFSPTIPQDQWCGHCWCNDSHQSVTQTSYICWCNESHQRVTWTCYIWGCNESRERVTWTCYIDIHFCDFFLFLTKDIFIIFMTTVKVISFGQPLLLCFWNSMILRCTIRRKYFWTPKNSIACGWVIFQVWLPTHTPPPPHIITHLAYDLISWLAIWRTWIKWLVSLLFSNQ